MPLSIGSNGSLKIVKWLIRNGERWDWNIFCGGIRLDIFRYLYKTHNIHFTYFYPMVRELVLFGNIPVLDYLIRKNRIHITNELLSCCIDTDTFDFLYKNYTHPTKFKDTLKVLYHIRDWELVDHLRKYGNIGFKLKLRLLIKKVSNGITCSP